MSDSRDEDKTRAALDELEPWACEEIKRLEQQFEARSKPSSLIGKKRSRAGFYWGIFCGLIITAMAFFLFAPLICNHS